MMDRYSRQVLFAPIGEEGQRAIRRSRVAIVGVGAMGSVSSEMLVRAGVGTLRLIDRDYVDVTNLQRQSLFDEKSLEQSLPKAVAAAERLRQINSDVEIEDEVVDVNSGNVDGLIENVDLLLDGTDNFETRFLLNDACVQKGLPWIYAACVGSYGMSFVVRPGTTACLRCVMETEPPPGTSPSCDTAGIIAPIVRAIVAFQVTEALKILVGKEDELVDAVLTIDLWKGLFETYKPSAPKKQCPACGLREFPYLRGDSETQSVSLCGRNAVQVRPLATQELRLDEVAERLRRLGEVKVNPHLLRVTIGDKEIVLFKDGRAMIHGTDDPSEAKSLYAKYVGL
jgi:adenylyltransferase/sulfurtransferase